MTKMHDVNSFSNSPLYHTLLHSRTPFSVSKFIKVTHTTNFRFEFEISRREKTA